ncbi:phage antirepressor KilAC domain-containing protein [Brachybacterium massiliense]|uniref:phage antirepressor KilAC domain-containing protein n=1 Tax=Brachybacterium massiliense TaxID=1755098 RepID=UPI000B3BB7A3|nr:phage antirepressor KilAC domain-containing protein [Brachybacterium massiliense]
MSDLTPSTPSAESPFDAIKRTRPDGAEFWSARDLMPLLGYSAWRNFEVPLERARKSAEAQGHVVAEHFAGSRKVASSGPSMADFQLSRFAAYLVAMNGDPNKSEVAAAQAYFAIRTREAEVAEPAPVALPGRRELAQMVLEAEDRADREAIARARVEYQLEKQQPVVDYHQKFVAEHQDIVTIDNFASQYGTTGPKVRELMKETGVAVRRVVAQRWSKSKGRMVDDYEWRPRQGVLSSDWFVLRPQHNAPRLHNGQVRQTLYVLQYRVQHLATKLGLTAPVLDFDGSDPR